MQVYSTDLNGDGIADVVLQHDRFVMPYVQTKKGFVSVDQYVHSLSAEDRERIDARMRELYKNP